MHRCPVALIEHERDLESHLINLEAGELATAFDQATHPKGVVPATVDEGKQFIKMIDIIRPLAGPETTLSIGSDDFLLWQMSVGTYRTTNILTYDELLERVNLFTQQTTSCRFPSR